MLLAEEMIYLEFKKHFKLIDIYSICMSSHLLSKWAQVSRSLRTHLLNSWPIDFIFTLAKITNYHRLASIIGQNFYWNDRLCILNSFFCEFKLTFAFRISSSEFAWICYDTFKRCDYTKFFSIFRHLIIYYEFFLFVLSNPNLFHFNYFQKWFSLLLSGL